MDEQQIPQQYFTAEIEDKIRNLSEEDMYKTLSNLEQSEFWIAILKYNQIRLSMSQSALFAGDPVKEPTMMTRQQGIMLGLSDLQNAVITIVQNKEQAAEEDAEDKGTDVK